MISPFERYAICCMLILHARIRKVNTSKTAFLSQIGYSHLKKQKLLFFNGTGWPKINGNFENKKKCLLPSYIFRIQRKIPLGEQALFYFQNLYVILVHSVHMKFQKTAFWSSIFE
jgi:hypothetical protein